MFSKEIKYSAIHVAIFTIFIHFLVVLSAGDGGQIPADKAQLVSWFNANVKPFAQRKGTLDPELAAAEAAPRVIKVRKDGKGEFKTVNDAIKSIPKGNTKRVIIWIGPGNYQEKVKIDRDKKFVTLYGSPNAMPNLTFAGTAAKFGTLDSATLIAEGDYFMACNLFIVNSAPRPDGKMKGAQAVALRASGDKSAFYNCRLIGFQDTLCDDKGNHFFKDCYIEGTYDFIFGNGKSMYLSTTLHVLTDKGFTVITAQGGDVETVETGYSFVHCNIIGAGKGSYLGRAWKASPQVVYAYTNMGEVVHSGGWSEEFKAGSAKTVFYGEYKCTGPGSKPHGRVKFYKQLTDAQVKPFLTLGYINGNKWLLPPPKV